MLEQSVLEEPRIDIRAMDIPTFHAQLIDLRNIVVPDEPVTDFDAKKNAIARVVHLDEIEGLGHRFPHARDKVALLDYGFRKAQQAEDPHNAAIISAATIVIVHLWGQGNGRASREWYEHLTTGKPFTTPQRAPGTIQDDEARARIDFGSVWDEPSGIIPSIRDRDVCESTGADYNLMSHQRVIVHLLDNGLSDREQTTLTDAEKSGLTDEEIADIKDAIGADKFGNVYSKDSSGLRYAVAAMSQHESVQGINRESGKAHVFNLRTFLSEVSLEEKKLFISKLWIYRREAAKASIDLLSDDGGGARRVNHKGHEITLREYILSRMNYLKPEERPGSDLLGQAAVAAQRVVE